MDAENYGIGRAARQSRSQYVADTTFDNKIIIPLVTIKDGSRQALGKLQPAPTRRSVLQQWAKRVESGVVADVIGLELDARPPKAGPLHPPGPHVRENVSGADCAKSLGYRLQRRRPAVRCERCLGNARDCAN